MNPLAPVALISAAAAIVSTTVIAQQKKRITKLNSEILTKDAQLETWIRNFEHAMHLLDPKQHLDLLNAISNDSKFDRIIIDNL